MKPSISLVIFFFAFVSVSFSQTSSETGKGQQADDAKPPAQSSFTSEEGGFSIAMPGAPPKITGHSEEKKKQSDYAEFSWPTNIGTFTVRYMDAARLGIDRFQSKIALSKLRKALIDKIKGKVLHESEIMLGSHSGQEIIIEDQDGFYIHRFYVVGKRIYDVNAYLPERLRSEQARALRILNSFSLTNPPPLTPTEVGEVDLLLKSLREKNEVVLGNCVDAAQCQPLSDLEKITRTDKGEVKVGKLISRPQPDYPSIAKSARASGTVPVWVIVNEEGKVMAAQVVGGHPMLHAVTINAAREARFAPTLLNGKPVKVNGLILYRFFLQ